MRITRIQIDRFGLWRNLDLPLNPHGISVISGPNEAGKSTLLSFIRGVLYGFPVAETHGHPRESAFLGGTLHVLHQERPLEISRRRGDASRPRLTIPGADPAIVADADDILTEITAGTTRRTFQNLFALGLTELQQLATLRSSDVAERMYGASLGADGKRLLTAIRDGETQRRSLFDADRRTGALAGLMEQDAALTAEMRDLGSQREEFDRLCRERSRLAGVIDEMKSRQAGMQSQLRGHRFMQRIQDPWSQVRDCERELAGLPVVTAFPPDGTERLRELESEVDSDSRCRRTLLAEIEELQVRRKAVVPDPAALRSIGTLRRIVARRERIEQIAAERDSTQQSTAAEAESVKAACRSIGNGWERQRLESVNLSPARQQELLQAANGFQKTIVRRGRLRKVYKLTSQAFRKLRGQVEQGRERWGEQSVAEAIELEGQRSNRHLLQQRADQLRQRREELRTFSERDERVEPVPGWFRRVLLGFSIAGGLVALAGLLTTFTLNAGSGLVLCLAGLTGLGAAWGLQLHSQSAARDADEARKTVLRSVERELQEISAKLESAPDAGNADEEASPETRIADLVSREAYHRLRRRLEERRRRMTELRQRFESVKQQFSHARQAWCDALKRAGLDVILKLDDAFAHWQSVFEAKERLAGLHSAEGAAERAEGRYRRLLARLQRSAEQMQLPMADADDPVRIVQDWQVELQKLEAARDESRRIRGEIHKRRQEARHYGRHLSELNRRLNALLVQGGAADREEFEQRAEAVSRRTELEELLAMAQEELAKVAAAEPELAIVEEDLEAYNAAEHAECIRALELELSDLSRDLQNADEELGSVKQAESKLAADDRETQLQIDRLRREEEIVASLEAWLAEDVVAQSLEVVKSRFERTHQPAVLAAASDFLHRFTRGRYPRVWAPLGRSRLFVDDRWDDSWDLDELSGGTREQVFLALRLALVEDYSQQGIELPLILDDVLVNFDRQRTEAAVETLQHVATSGRQILFLTCHEHVADAFRRTGVTPLELPEQARERERRMAG